MNPTIRNLTQPELHELVRWAAAEGWNPGVNDAALFWDVDPEGYLAVDMDQRMVGGGAIIRHNANFGFMGLFIVDPDYRGQQLGTKLWYARRDALLDRLDENGTIGLDGVDAMVPFYEKGGFKQFTRHRRFEFADPNQLPKPTESLEDLATLPFEKVEELDRQCFPGPRSEYLKSWINQPGHQSLAMTIGEKVTGFGVVRPCLSGWKIGPLYAETPSTAEQLFLGLCEQTKAGPVYLDIPDNNPAAIDLCERYQMSEVFGCERMYLGHVPDLAYEKIYGVTTLELG